jgi:hypothetical protein
LKSFGVKLSDINKCFWFVTHDNMTYVRPYAKEFLTFVTTLFEIVAPWALWLVIA